MRYTEIAEARPFSGTPKINLPSAYGASPNKPIILRIPVTGERPIEYFAHDLPEGLSLDGGIITGKVAREGNYTVTLRAKNALGEDSRTLTIEIHEGAVLLTPLLGFTSWNAFGFEVSARDMEWTAKRMLELGLAEYGYSYINTDSGWQGEYGGEFDAIMPNEKFPDMKGMCQRLHEMGFKCGIYSTPMLNAFGCAMTHVPLPPGCTRGEPDPRFADERGGIGTVRCERNCALQWEAWGFDYLKYDWRPSDPYNAELMRRELVGLSRDFGFCVTVKARPEYHTYWERYCNSYRCSTDSVGNFKNLLEIYSSYFDFIEYTNKGHYYDLDMLDTGKCSLFEKLGFTEEEGFGYTEDEELVLYSMRAFLNSPIQLSCILDELSDFEMAMYCNEEIIAINQDCEYAPSVPIMLIEGEGRKLHAFRKRLEGGEYAIAVFNLGECREDVKIYLDSVASVRDVWAKREMGDMKLVRLDMPRHTVRIFRVKPKGN